MINKVLGYELTASVIQIGQKPGDNTTHCKRCTKIIAGRDGVRDISLCISCYDDFCQFMLNKKPLDPVIAKVPLVDELAIIRNKKTDTYLGKKNNWGGRGKIPAVYKPGTAKGVITAMGHWNKAANEDYEVVRVSIYKDIEIKV